MIPVVSRRTQVVGAASPRATSLGERLLVALGADPDLVDAVLGDLAEEYAGRATHGAGTARFWYAREALRSAPHLVAGGLRRGWRGQRARLAACLLAAVVASVTLLLTHHARSAASLDADGDGGVVVNSVQPVRLPVRVLDAAGRLVRTTGVHFRWESGAPLAISPSGLATCARPGDATVRASLGALSTELLVHCRPVRAVYGPPMLDLVVGEPAQDVPFEAVGVDGRTVTLLAGQLAVRDSTIATLEGQRIRARRAGTTEVRARFGDRSSVTSVHVYEPAASPDSIRPGQHLAVPVRLAAGEMRQWRLPAGHYFVRILPRRGDRQRPLLVVPEASCRPARGHFACVARHPVTMYAFHPRTADRSGAVSGTLAVWRLGDP